MRSSEVAVTHVEERDVRSGVTYTPDSEMIPRTDSRIKQLRARLVHVSTQNQAVEALKQRTYLAEWSLIRWKRCKRCSSKFVWYPGLKFWTECLVVAPSCMHVRLSCEGPTSWHWNSRESWRVFVCNGLGPGETADSGVAVKPGPRPFLTTLRSVLCREFWTMLFGCPKKGNLSQSMQSTNFHASYQTRSEWTVHASLDNRVASTTGSWRSATTTKIARRCYSGFTTLPLKITMFSVKLYLSLIARQITPKR
jgi:hypothetical protein